MTGDMLCGIIGVEGGLVVMRIVNGLPWRWRPKHYTQFSIEKLRDEHLIHVGQWGIIWEVGNY